MGLGHAPRLTIRKPARRKLPSAIRVSDGGCSAERGGKRGTANSPVWRQAVIWVEAVVWVVVVVHHGVMLRGAADLE